MASDGLLIYGELYIMLIIILSDQSERGGPHAA